MSARHGGQAQKGRRAAGKAVADDDSDQSAPAGEALPPASPSAASSDTSVDWNNPAFQDALMVLLHAYCPEQFERLMTLAPIARVAALFKPLNVDNNTAVLRIISAQMEHTAAAGLAVAGLATPATPLRSDDNRRFASDSPRRASSPTVAGDVTNSGVRFPRTPLAIGDGDGTIIDGTAVRVFEYLATRKGTATTFFTHVGRNEAELMALQADVRRLTPAAGTLLARNGYTLIELMSADAATIETAFITASLAGDPLRAWWAAAAATARPVPVTATTTGAELAQAISDRRRWRNDLADFMDGQRSAAAAGPGAQGLFPRMAVTYGDIITEWLLTVFPYLPATEGHRLAGALLSGSLEAQLTTPYARVHRATIPILNQFRNTRPAARAAVAITDAPSTRPLHDGATSDDVAVPMPTMAATQALATTTAAKRATPAETQRNEDIAKGQCFVCHRAGHRAAQCPSKAALPAATTASN